MADTFLDFYNEIQGYAGEALDVSLAQTLVQRAHREILEARSWSFLFEEGVLQAPDAITAGAVTVTQFSKTVTCDATAKAALNAADNTVSLGSRQFRVGATNRIYNIDSYNTGTGVITLKETYTEASGAGSGYTVFKCYYSPPVKNEVNGVIDFLRFISVRDLVNGRSLKLGVQKQEIDRRDPFRTSAVQPVAVVSYKPDDAGNPLFELWPWPSQSRGYVCLYSRRGTTLQNDADVLQYPVTGELLMAKAHYHLAKWAEMNVGRDPSLRGPDWRFILTEASQRFEKLLFQAKKQDDEIFTQNVFLNKFFTWGPPSASYLQDHDTWW